jgi:hypothetical protein
LAAQRLLILGVVAFGCLGSVVIGGTPGIVFGVFAGLFISLLAIIGHAIASRWSA